MPDFHGSFIITNKKLEPNGSKCLLLQHLERGIYEMRISGKKIWPIEINPGKHVLKFGRRTYNLPGSGTIYEEPFIINGIGEIVDVNTKTY